MEIGIEEVRNSESTRRWFASLLDLWGPSAVREELLERLARFCVVVGKTPDEIIDECLRATTAGDTFVLRTRARKQFMEQIEHFEAQTASRDEANVVRSFFIHNGIAMNPSILV
ncbi:MAG: hypothetical protein IT300_04470 [Dehalococcoidia bacterium]|nr:hypothetical protein [Dehalococcoidia bacterium]